MKAVLISIRPQWCDLIACGKKTIEVRKTRPKLETPFRCYIYCTSAKTISLEEYVHIHAKTGGKVDEWNGKVIGEFLCDAIYTIKNVGSFYVAGKSRTDTNAIANASCLDFTDMRNYLGDKDGFAWHISGLKIYEQPLQFPALMRPCSFEGPCAICRYAELDQADEMLICENRVQKPPQSWCYVEEFEVDTNG